MLIDWFTVGAQALNFIVLVWLLKRFLYKPILNAVDAREKLIATELAEAAAKKAEAQQQSDTFRRNTETFDQQRAGLLSKATFEAAAERERLLGAARDAADALGAKRQDALRAGAQTLNASIRRRTQEEVFAIARRALMDLAGASVEHRMAEVFTQRVLAIDGEAKLGFAEALKTTNEPAVVRSAFDIPADQRTAIRESLEKAFSATIDLRFETNADLVSGIELGVNGQKISWSIDDYLGSLEAGVADLLRRDDKPAPKPVLGTLLQEEPKLVPASREKVLETASITR